MKTPEEILRARMISMADGKFTFVCDVKEVVEAMEEYAVQSVETATANAVHQIEMKQEELDQEKELVATLQGQVVDVTIERDEFDEANKKQALALKLVSHRADELERDLKEYTTLYREYKDRYDYAVIDGTDLRQKLEQQEDRFDQLDGEYQDLVRICTAIYKLDKHVLKAMVNESLGGDNYEKLKDHLGV